jgi:Zn-finger in ubiquitin-hydrolases and other protein
MSARCAGAPAAAIVDSMRLLSTIQSAFRGLLGSDGVACAHVDQIRDVTPASRGCEQCLALGDTWVHLRMCMTCGIVVCCDSSKNTHAHRHAREQAPDHQIIRSMQPGEDWLWCFTDQVAVRARR